MADVGFSSVFLLQLNTPFMVTWEFEGMATSWCSIDGGRPSRCTSPLRLTVRDQLNHTLALTYNDNCSNNKTQVLTYSLRGWSTNFTADTAAAVGLTDGAVPLPTGTAMRRRDRSAAGGVALRVGLMLWLVLLVAAWLQ
jgi:hypothetical protein